MTPDDARVALDAALPHDDDCHSRDHALNACDCGAPSRRAAVWPIIAGLEEEMAQERNYRFDIQEQLDAAKAQWKVDLDRAQAATTVANDTATKLEAKLAAAEAERVAALANRREDADRYTMNYNALKEKLGGAEALLQRRPHLDTTEEVCGTHSPIHEEAECARLGGACAK